MGGSESWPWSSYEMLFSGANSAQIPVCVQKAFKIQQLSQCLLLMLKKLKLFCECWLERSGFALIINHQSPERRRWSMQQ